MADVTGGAAAEREAPPRTLLGRLGIVGPGIVVAVTGVGAGDMVTSLVAGTGFGMALLWAVVLGALLKCFLTEGIGRWYMASGETILEGWHSIGRLASGYFVMYLLIATFVFGAAITSTCALAVNAMFPDVLPQWAWAALHAVAAFLLIGVGRYGLFERVMKLFATVKFGIVVLLGVLLAPSLSELALGLVPRVPEGSFWNILAVIGGVGGTFTLASYGYWVREHGWRRPEWVPTMRIDVVTGYVLTGVFMVSMMIVGAQLLYGTGTSIEGSESLVTLANPLEERFGPLVRWLFLIGFWAVATGAMLGSWNGGAHLFADYVRIARGVSDQEAAEEISEKSPWFRSFFGLDHLPAHGAAHLRSADHAGDRVRFFGSVVLPVPRPYATLPPELPPCGPRVPQPHPHQRRPCGRGAALYRRRGAGGAERSQRPRRRLVLDVHTRSQYERDRTLIPGSVRVLE